MADNASCTLRSSVGIGGVELSDFKEAVHRYGMGVTDAQVNACCRHLQAYFTKVLKVITLVRALS